MEPIKAASLSGRFSKAPSEVLVCRLRTVLTTAMDVSASKTLRKVEEGEIFEALEEAKEDEKRKLQRVKVRRHPDVTLDLLY